MKHYETTLCVKLPAACNLELMMQHAAVSCHCHQWFTCLRCSQGSWHRDRGGAPKAVSHTDTQLTIDTWHITAHRTWLWMNTLRVMNLHLQVPANFMFTRCWPHSYVMAYHGISTSWLARNAALAHFLFWPPSTWAGTRRAGTETCTAKFAWASCARTGVRVTCGPCEAISCFVGNFPRSQMFLPSNLSHC